MFGTKVAVNLSLTVRRGEVFGFLGPNGAQGTLMKDSDRRGPGYVLIWVKDGIIYCLAGQGDSSKAVTLANSLD